MKLDMLQNATKSMKQQNKNKQSIVESVSSILGVDRATKLFESFEVTPADYDKWLDVITGYAREEGINIRTKTGFQDVAYAVLENDPLLLDQEVQDAVVNTLWAKQKVNQQHSKVEGFAKQREEEEQLQYALKQLKSPRSEENEEEDIDYGDLNDKNDPLGMQRYHIWAQKKNPIPTTVEGIREKIKRLKGQSYSREQQEEIRHLFAILKRKGASYEDEEYDDATGTIQRKQGTYRERWHPDENPDEIELRPGFDEDDEDQSVPAEAWSSYSRDPKDYEENEEDGDDWDIDLDQYPEDESQFGDDEEDYNDFNDPRDQSVPAEAWSSNSRDPKDYEEKDVASEQNYEQEESTRFSKGQFVVYKKDGAKYKVEIPDGPGEQVGILVNGRIKLVPSKDLEVERTSEESEESTSKQPKKLSFLHDILTGKHSKEHLSTLQKQVETEGSNAWTTHHAKSPRNPHPKGSLAYKHWQRGFEGAAKEIWSPKKVEVDQKSKPKKKK